jgi:hypothetical protein
MFQIKGMLLSAQCWLPYINKLKKHCYGGRPCKRKKESTREKKKRDN